MSNYKNPFADYNSNIMSSEQIFELFAEPFDLFEIKESDIANEKSSIVFIGGRGTGKTMLLRQFSYRVQKVSLLDKQTFLEKTKDNQYIGIYFRVDNPLLRSLDAIVACSTDCCSADFIFTHYFELTVFKEYLEIVKVFLLETDIDNTIQKNMISELKGLLECDELASVSNINELLLFVIAQINYIWKYQSEKAIDIDGTVEFSPSCGIILQGRLTDEFLKTNVMKVFELENVNILLLIDEFENFSETQQRVLNTAMRFSKDYGARYRIGMRPNGFKTFGTLDNADFVKEGRDYRKVEFGFPYIRKGNELYTELVKRIANKRLSLIKQFEGINIEDILGKSEDLETEAKEIVKNRTKHFDAYLKLINSQSETMLETNNLQCLKHENPLYEMENLRLLLSGYSLEYVCKAFNDYINNIESDEAKKYFNDYDKKYKLSFLFVLCSIYQIERKKYYSFVDYCHLSSGIVGCFIELCRRAFDIAYFKDRESLFSGSISAKIQTDAAYEYAQSEREMIKRISEYGGSLYTFIDNVGDTFSFIHKDKYI